MAYTIPSLEKLIDKFASFPGIGRKTAARLAYWMLSLDKKDAADFANAILEAHEKVHQCPICHNLTDTEQCGICTNLGRDRSTICVVENPSDVNAIEKTNEYKGLYHVMHGLISPMQKKGPDELYIKDLVSRCADDTVKEVIMATNPTIDGESTAIYISRLLKPFGIKITRLAYGMPVGGNIEYADDVTLYRALEGRSEL